MAETKRLDIFEKKIGDISIGQAVIKSEIKGIGKSISMLVDIRAESLHLMKQQEANLIDHNDLFTRMRVVEASKASCATDRKAIKKDVSKLERNQRWGILTVFGVVIAAISPLLKKAFLAIFPGGF